MDIIYNDYNNPPTLIDQFFIFGYDPNDPQLLKNAFDGYRVDTIQKENKNSIALQLLVQFAH